MLQQHQKQPGLQKRMLLPAMSKPQRQRADAGRVDHTRAPVSRQSRAHRGAAAVPTELAVQLAQVQQQLLLLEVPLLPALLPTSWRTAETPPGRRRVRR